MAGPATPGGMDATAPEQGTKAAAERATAAVPMASGPALTPVPMDAPTQRPSEPVTAGLPIGPGAGAAPTVSRDDQVMAKLQGLVLASRDPQLAILVGRLNASRSRRR